MELMICFVPLLLILVVIEYENLVFDLYYKIIGKNLIGSRTVTTVSSRATNN